MLEIIKNFYNNNIFTFELLFAYLPFIPLLKPKKHWWIGVSVSVVVLLVLSHFLCFPFHNAHWLISCSWYMLTAILTVIALKVSVEGNWWFLIFVGTGAYAIEHLFYRCKNFLQTLLWMNNLGDWYDLLYWFLMAAILFLAWLFFIRRISKEKKFKANNIKLLVMTVIVALSLMVLSRLEAIYLWTYSLWNTPIALLFSLFGMLTCMFVLSNLFSNIHNKKLEEELIIIQSLWQSDRRQYQLSKQNIELLNMKYHDLKYQINSLLRSEGTLADEQSLKEAIQCLNVYDAKFQTGNDTLDVVLTEKKLQCDLLKIQFSCMAQGELLSHLRPVDIYSIFGNALDNAMDCLKKVEEEDLRFVNVVVKQVNGVVKIQIENYTPHNVVIENGFPVTTKEDKENHGFGIKSIAYIVEKYKGVLQFSVEDDMFLLEIALPLNK